MFVKKLGKFRIELVDRQGNVLETKEVTHNELINLNMALRSNNSELNWIMAGRIPHKVFNEIEQGWE